MALFTLFKGSSVDFSTLHKNNKTQLSQNAMAMLACKGFCNDNYKCPMNYGNKKYSVVDTITDQNICLKRHISSAKD